MPLTTLISRLFSSRANARLVAVARIIVGVTSVLAGFEMWRLLGRLLIPTVLRLTYFDWLPSLSQRSVSAFALLWLAAAIAFTLGWHTRVVGAVLTVVIAYALMLDQQLYSNHLYLLFLIVLLLTIADSGAAISLDARHRPSATIHGWPVQLLRIQLSTVYIFSALAKITPEYLAGDVLINSLKHYGYFAFPNAWRVPLVLRTLAFIAIAVELFIGLGLWSRSVRRAAVAAGVGFHLFIIATLDSSRLSLGIFALEMFALYLLFFDDAKAVACRTNSQDQVQ